MDLRKRLGIISEIVHEKPGLGKTAIMKYIFLLQQLEKVSLGYEYEIYTYGPYSSEVMEDIDYAKQQDIIAIHRETYSGGFSGYSIQPSNQLDRVLEQEKEFINENKKAIEDVISTFGNNNAKELELLTTIIYLYSAYQANGWPIDEVPSNVHDIKPHFNLATIEEEYQRLKEIGILQLCELSV